MVVLMVEVIVIVWCCGFFITSCLWMNNGKEETSIFLLDAIFGMSEEMENHLLFECEYATKLWT